MGTERGRQNGPPAQQPVNRRILQTDEDYCGDDAEYQENEESAVEATKIVVENSSRTKRCALLTTITVMVTRDGLTHIELGDFIRGMFESEGSERSRALFHWINNSAYVSPGEGQGVLRELLQGYGMNTTRFSSGTRQRGRSLP